jgi:hypothetical protein
MIDPKELRIGNLIYYDDTMHRPKENVERIVSHEIIYGLACGDDKHYHPIPLSEDIVTRLGFERSEWTGARVRNVCNAKTSGLRNKNNYCFRDGSGNYSVNTIFGKLWESPVLDGVYEFKLMHETRIKFVHQLQNLYFALTGKELEIK